MDEVLLGHMLPSCGAAHALRGISLWAAPAFTLLSDVTDTHGKILSRRLVLLGLRRSSGSYRDMLGCVLVNDRRRLNTENSSFSLMLYTTVLKLT